jgi:ClpP class serine protease
VGETYAMFKARVGAGRGLPPEKVEEVARGRVWSGAAAQGQGLVDQLGGFDAAVQRARVEAGISEKADVALVSYGSRPGPDGELASRELRSRLATTLMGGAPRLNLPPELQRWMDLGPLANERVLMMMPYTIEVE